MERRTFNTKTREPWNPVIKTCLDAIDRHTASYLKTGHVSHLKQAQLLRDYVSGLKDWIQLEEG